MSLHERLAKPTQLMVSPSSHGAVTAQRWSSDGWVQGRVDLTITDGDLVASADAQGRIVVTAFDLGVGTIDIPASVVGTAAQLTNVRLHLDAAPPAPTTWADDDDASATTTFDVTVNWSLMVNGSATMLGPQKLTNLPGTLVLGTDGVKVDGSLDVEAAGDVWSWADLVKLSDLSLSLSAETPDPI
jgi:hypothetical protein